MTDELVIVPLRLGPLWNFTYLVGSRVTGEALVIDPAWDVDAIVAEARRQKWRITAAVVTHGHDDHAHGLSGIVRITGTRVLVHHEDAETLRAAYDGPAVRVEHGHELRLGGVCVRLLHTPGHTPGSLCVQAGGALFTGDTLMVGTLGRHGAYPGARLALWRSMCEVLAGLPDVTATHPGHDSGPHPHSTLRDERRVNRALTARTYEEFCAVLAGSGMHPPSETPRAKQTREPHRD